MQFKRISLKDKSVFYKYLSLRQHNLSVYAFENIFIWKKLYNIFWINIDKNLCIFFRDKIGCFLYLPPLGKGIKQAVFNRCFEIMDNYNKNTVISRIENIEEDCLSFYRKLGYQIILGGCDYVCKRKSLVDLRGSYFKKKRSAINSFIRNYEFDYRPYVDGDKRECTALYKLWMSERKKNNQDTIYQRLLEDNFVAFKTTLDCYSKLNFAGRVIKIDNKIEAVTFGYNLSNRDFVVVFEICNLKFKGIAQYIFREFCREQSSQNINIMDDSGIMGLKRIKLSYLPFKTEQNFIVRNG
ncbi:MAG: phosphatidylglycerol lysyltransferase domain-containing protein [Candidatus Omnitrophota bacterium]